MGLASKKRSGSDWDGAIVWLVVASFVVTLPILSPVQQGGGWGPADLASPRPALAGSGRSIVTNTSTSEPAPHLIVELLATDKTQLQTVNSLAPKLLPGDDVDIYDFPRAFAINTSLVDRVAAELRANLSAGVNLSVNTGLEKNVATMAPAVVGYVQGIAATYEPGPSGATAPGTYNFSACLANFSKDTAVAHAAGLESIAYPTGVPLLNPFLQSYGWNYGRIAQITDQVWVETQEYATDAANWSSALSKLIAQFQGAHEPLSKLAVQVTLGKTPNATYSDPATAVVAIRAAVAAGIDHVYVWTAEGYEADLIALLHDLNRSNEYAVTFAESGLPAALTWKVTVDGIAKSLTTNGATDALQWQDLPNGTYSYRITDVSGWHEATLPYSGSVKVDGASVTEPTLIFSGVTYTVTFSESGLPSGLTWKVTVDGAVKSLLTDGATDTLTWQSLPNGTYGYRITDISGWHQTTLPYSGSVSVKGASVIEPTLAFDRVTYEVTFTETGLPGGMEWWVNLTNGLSYSGTGNAVTFGEPNGSYDYAIATVDKSYEAAGGIFAVQGTAVPESIVFSEVVYIVTFAGTGLPPATNWSVTLGGMTRSSTAGSITFAEPNGTYAFVASAQGWQPSPRSGSVTVNGKVVDLTISFAPATYSVSFAEKGLPQGTLWAATLDGITENSTTATIDFTAANGTHRFTVETIAGYSVTPLSGSLTVNGTSISESVTFTELTYAVTFTETGLPSGSSWSVTLNGVAHPSAGAEITFTEPNGTYRFDVGSVAGYTVDPPSGSMTVDGASANQPVLFAPVTYAVTFMESGLPSGTNWSVSLNEVTESSLSDSVIFPPMANGTYSYEIGDVSGWHQSTLPYAGTVTVHGAPTAEPSLTFVRVTYPVTFTETGIAPGTTWTVEATAVGSLESWFVNSTGPTATLRLPNGTYTYTLDAPGYHSVTYGGQVVSGTMGHSISVAMSPIRSPPSSFLGMYLALGALGAVVLIGVAIGFALRWDRRR